MITNNYYNPEPKKHILCKYNCGASLTFDPNILSGISRKVIPLNLDGTLHNCPNRSHKCKDSIRTCYYCKQEITFHDDRTAPSGKKIPLNLNDTVHDCENNPFNRSKKENQVN
jgi:hypothetical protein